MHSFNVTIKKTLGSNIDGIIKTIAITSQSSIFFFEVVNFSLFKKNIGISGHRIQQTLELFISTVSSAQILP